jgi:hypothetical protein
VSHRTHCWHFEARIDRYFNGRETITTRTNVCCWCGKSVKIVETSKMVKPTGHGPHAPEALEALEQAEDMAGECHKP